jgi:hypothetical protein
MDGQFIPVESGQGHRFFHTSNRTKLEKLGVTDFVTGYMIDKSSLEKALAQSPKTDALIASAAGYTGHTKGDNPQTDTEGYKNLADATKAANISRFVLNSELGITVDVGWDKPVSGEDLAEAFSKVLVIKVVSKPAFPGFVVNFVLPVIGMFNPGVKDMHSMIKWIKTGVYKSKNTQKQKELFSDLPTVEEAVKRYSKDKKLV